MEGEDEPCEREKNPGNDEIESQGIKAFVLFCILKQPLVGLSES